MNVTAQTTFGELLRRYRLATGLTQEELAERAGLSVRGLNYLERGRRQPYPDTVQRLAAALDLAAPERTALTQAARQGRASAPQSITPPASPPPPQAAAAPVPASGTGASWPATPLLGRERELEELGMLLRRSNGRLVTLTGPAGVGKTHLALQVAATLQEQFAHGVIVVSLAPLRDAALVLPALAQALGLRETPGQPLLDALCAALAGQDRLLVLDNCEQIVEAASHLAALLAACPRLRLLATSRTPLRLRAEQEYPLAPLALPDLAALPPVEGLAQVPAVALFVARAQAVKPAFALTAANARAVAQVCVRLDGLPLAIELAAARIKLFAPRELAVRLERRLPLLTGGARDLPERQRTMRGAIAWSHALLTVAERVLFRRLAVFVGGATLEAILAVAAAQEARIDRATQGREQVGQGVDEVDVLAWLEELVDHNLLRVEVQEEEPRYSMLETIREYGLEQLAASGEEEQVRARHAAYYLSLAEEGEPALQGPEQHVWLKRLEREHDNLRAALQWAQDSGKVEIGLRLCGELVRFWDLHGYLAEGRHWSQTFLRLERSAARVTPSIRAKVLVGTGALAYAQGEYVQARALVEEGLSLEQFVDNKAGVALALNILGCIAEDEGKISEAVAHHEHALTLRRAIGDDWSIAHSLLNLGVLVFNQGDDTRAVTLWHESLALFREVGDGRGVGYVLMSLADVSRDQDNRQQAASYYTESLLAFQRIGDKNGVAGCLEGLAGLAIKQGLAQRAARLLGAADGLRKDIGAPRTPDENRWYSLLLDTVAASLGTVAIAPTWADAQAAPWERIVAEVLEDDSIGRKERCSCTMHGTILPAHGA